MVSFVEDNTILNSIRYFENHVHNILCVKPEEVDPIELNFSMTNKYFDTTQIYN